ncbi:phospholipid carrier-dependent glycosyltransferase [Planctomycetota bacterium]|nr:phospholipid carrier-dependent glycosyltransferase [Planctomycetota bacterium]
MRTECIDVEMKKDLVKGMRFGVRDVVFLIVVVVIAFAVRVGLTQQFVGLGAEPDAGAQPDQLDYEMFAWRMASGDGYTLEDGRASARRSPGTSLTLLPVYWVMGHDYGAARLWLSLLSALTVVPMFVTCAIGFKEKLVGGIAALMMGLLPTHAYYALHYVSETPFVLYFAMAVCCAVVGLREGNVLKKKAFWIGLAGVFVGMAILTRGVLLFAYPILALYVLYLVYLKVRNKKSIASICLLAAVHLGCLSVVIGPWVVRNVVALGKPALATNVGHTLWGANNRLLIDDEVNQGGWIATSVLSAKVKKLEGNEVETDKQALNNALEFIFANPVFIGELCVKKVGALVVPFYTWHEPENKMAMLMFELGWLVMLPLGLLSIRWLVVSRDPYAVICLVLLLTLLWTTLFFYGSPRFRDSFLPVTVPLAAYGFYVLVGGLMKKTFRSAEARGA